MSNFKQYDTRWARLGYPKSPFFIKDCGCGEVAVANCITEIPKYADETPKTIQPYCKQYAAPNGDGTYWSGIPAMMAHYDMTEVQEHQTMKSLWKELEKGDRVAIYLMGTRPGGSKGVHWTSCGHFICSTDYKVKDGKHYVYVKDSNSDSVLRNGWISYEENMRNDVVKVWSGKLPKKATIKKTDYRPETPYNGKLPAGTVRLGDNGKDVKRLQKFLNWCIGAKLNCKGHFRSVTLKDLKIWQKTYGIEADGIWGPICKKKAQSIVKKYAPEDKKKSKYYSETTIIGEARCNEKGTLSGGKPGDQTGKEVGIGSWYNGGWLYMFRAKDKTIRDKIAQAMMDTCNNSNIGYNIDVPNRYAAWDNAEKNKHDIKGISKKGDTTCSQAVSMCLRAVGIPKQYAPRHMDIVTMTKVMKGSPYFDKYTDKAHIKSGANLLPGDILLSSHHTAIVVKSPNA
jgi:hypothetical protein